MSARAFPALGFDPAPGDLGDAEHLARTVRDASSTLAEVDSVVSSSGTDTWRGQASTAFRELVGEDLAPAIRDASQSFNQAARALTGWTSTLSDQQRRADVLERRAQAALDRLEAAEHALASVGPAPTEASLTTGGQQPTDQKVERAQQEHTQVVDARKAAISDAQGDYDAAVREAQSLLAEAESEAATVAQALADAGDIAPDKPGLLDRIGGALSDFGSWIAEGFDWFMTNVMPIIKDLVDLIGTVLAIASFFFPALAPFALAFAIASVGINVLRALHGEEGAWQEALVGAVGLGAGAAFGKAAQIFSKNAGPMFQPVIAGVSGGTATGGAVATAGFSVNSIAPLANAGWLVLKLKDAKGVADAIPTLMQPATNLGERVRNTVGGNGPVTNQERYEREKQAS